MAEAARDGDTIEITNGTYEGDSGVWSANSLTLRDVSGLISYIHHAKVGHQVNTRARENLILYNRTMDEVSGTAIYEIDFSNGGLAYLLGNVFHKGLDAENSVFISYGAEGVLYSKNELYAINNTAVNDRGTDSAFIQLKSPPARARVINNIPSPDFRFACGTVSDGSVVAPVLGLRRKEPRPGG